MCFGSCFRPEDLEDDQAWKGRMLLERGQIPVQQRLGARGPQRASPPRGARKASSPRGKKESSPRKNSREVSPRGHKEGKHTLQSNQKRGRTPNSGPTSNSKLSPEKEKSMSTLRSPEPKRHASSTSEEDEGHDLRAQLTNHQECKIRLDFPLNRHGARRLLRAGLHRNRVERTKRNLRKVHLLGTWVSKCGMYLWKRLRDTLPGK
jgi:hypothetical protein